MNKNLAGRLGEDKHSRSCRAPDSEVELMHGADGVARSLREVSTGARELGPMWGVQIW
jgi:hypothetical protein